MRGIATALGRRWHLLLALFIGGVGGLLYLPVWRLVTPLERAILVTGDAQRINSGVYAAMRDPIDWSRPFFFDNVDAPVGTTLFLIDGTPLISLPLRVLHQVFSISIDPAIALAWASLLFFALGCLSMARLAETLGASRRGAFLVGLVPLCMTPWISYLYLSTSSVSGWFSLVLAIDLLVRIRRTGLSRVRLLGLSLIMTLALGTTIYHWLSAAFLGGLLALSWVREYRRWPAALALSASLLLPALLCYLLGASGPLSVVLSHTGSGMVGIGIDGLLRSGIGGEPLNLDAIERWGLPTTIVVVLVAKRWLGLGSIGIGALLLGLYSLGSWEIAGGLLPDQLYHSLPFVGVYWSVFRFSTPIVILAIALLPTLIKARPVDGRPWRRVALAGVISLLLVGEALAQPWRGSLETRLPPPPEGWLGVGELIAAHELTVIDPNTYCYQTGWVLVEEGRYYSMQHARWELKEFTVPSETIGLSKAIIHFAAIDAADAGRSINTFDPARPTRGCPTSAEPDEIPGGSLVIAYRSPNPSDLIGRPETRPRLLEPTYLCAQTTAGSLFDIPKKSGQWAIDPSVERAPIRICSEKREAIERYAIETGARLVAPGAPW